MEMIIIGTLPLINLTAAQICAPPKFAHPSNLIYKARVEQINIIK